MAISQNLQRFFHNLRQPCRTRLNKSCCICQTRDKIKMQHVKHVRKRGHHYQGFYAEMVLLNRKQVPLCRKCHIAVHMRLHDGIKLSIAD